MGKVVRINKGGFQLSKSVWDIEIRWKVSRLYELTESVCVRENNICECGRLRCETSGGKYLSTPIVI